MILKKITVCNFRNIENAELLPYEGMNVIYGSNAQGKTGLLEAIWCFTGAKSFRGAKDNELIMFGRQKARNSLEFYSDGRDQTLVIEIEKKRTAVLNDCPYENAVQIAGKIPAIVFSPTDLGIVRDGPNLRRKFIDTAVCQLYPAYIGLLHRYTRALDQRNKLLKDIKYNPLNEEFIEDFEKELAVCGAKIIAYRTNYTEKLIKYLPVIFGGISDNTEQIMAEYITTAGTTEEEFLYKYKENRSEDIKNLSTSIGPHRDDIDIKINGISARNYGSEGQKRSAALSLKLAESEIITEITGQSPVALLDDVMSELDPKRQNFVLNHMKNRQVFITCCDPGNIGGLKNGKVFEVTGGKVR